MSQQALIELELVTPGTILKSKRDGRQFVKMAPNHEHGISDVELFEVSTGRIHHYATSVLDEHVESLLHLFDFSRT